MDPHKELDGIIMKKLASGGDTLQGRLHFGLETDFIPQFLALMFANDLPQITPFDLPTENRTRVISYTKVFVDDPKNDYELKKEYGLEDEIKTLLFQRCFIHLLLESHCSFQKRNRVEVEPQDVICAKEDWLGSVMDNNIMVKFQEFFEFTTDIDACVKSSEIEYWLSLDKTMSYKIFCIEMRKYCVINNINIKADRRRPEKKQISVWCGITKIDQNEC